MTRKNLITIHLYLAGFFAPMVFLVAVSGGLYLLGYKGEVSSEQVYGPVCGQLDPASQTLKADVQKILNEAGIEFDFEYVRGGDDTFHTRPTSRTHYVLKLADGQVTVTKQIPNLQKRLIELHKGHGPQRFKTFQKLFALGLFLIVSSGLFLGLSSPVMQRKTLVTSVSGALLFAALIFL